jgi:hypothetical protein
MKAKFAVAVLLTAICISFVRDISHTSHKTKKPLASIDASGPKYAILSLSAARVAVDHAPSVCSTVARFYSNRVYRV